MINKKSQYHVVQLYFFDQIESNNIPELKEIINKPIFRTKLFSDKNCIHLGFIGACAATSPRAKVIQLVYELFAATALELDKRVIQKAFTGSCLKNSVLSLKFLDEKFSLSKEMMMLDSSSFPTEPHLYRISHYASENKAFSERVECELHNSYNEHGFLEAARMGANDVINYLLSTSEKASQRLLEEAMIKAAINKKFDSVALMSEYLTDNPNAPFKRVQDSEYLQEYISQAPPEIKMFFDNLILKNSLDSSLQNNDTSIKRAKI